MKKTTAFLLGILCAIAFQRTLNAQTHTFTYPGSVTNSTTGQPVHGAHDITVRLYDGSGENVLHTEQFNVSVENGVFNLMIGSVTELSTTTVSKVRWLGVSIDGGEELKPRTAITGTPFASVASSLAPGAKGAVIARRRKSKQPFHNILH